MEKAAGWVPCLQRSTYLSSSLVRAFQGSQDFTAGFWMPPAPGVVLCTKEALLGVENTTYHNPL